ncbi:MAG: phospholipid carrier-dependent glycosyltransferase [Candidatus Daviesbacteria bacterium]|nr:phospholipid carrier-dependent glycosyltransferase [Candidatus Daviesbacteria bacterium]
MLKLPKIKSKYILILILLLAAFLRFYRLDYPNKYVFDEVYHAFTAKEYLKGSASAWEWWTASPPGVAYEWTHPPLAKEIMAASMFIFRTEDAWAYRFPGVVLGILSVYMVYLLGLKLLKNQTASLMAAFVFSLDGLNFVQSRTGMNDIYYVTFILAGLFLLLNKKFILAAILLGLALSSKWAAIYAFALILFILVKNRQKKKLYLFIFLPIVIYLLAYSPFFLIGHTFNQFKELQQQMWWYHTNLKATHAYSSPWWSWPLNLYPVWYFVDYQKNTMSNIFASGNPVLFWTGSIAILLTIWEIIKKRSISLAVIILGFLAFWLPWAGSPRIMFLYHFSPSVPFLSLALGYQLNKLMRDKKGKQLLIALLILILISFILVFPFLTGIHLPRNFINSFFATNLSKNPF